ncbi:hypothetical protein BU251_07360 [Candidatus Velamenicoccus archaeovorus]|uniref:Uncharacterized protein n=1 Tax=Velamenicoccus archaeovorus TaxID=1930593 RepID=A0A410P5S6_VELA1|nr:hypothetical protein BU251_07360 [Candidatus Velamenicoccus archaeovorus]
MLLFICGRFSALLRISFYYMPIKNKKPGFKPSGPTPHFAPLWDAGQHRRRAQKTGRENPAPFDQARRQLLISCSKRRPDNTWTQHRRMHHPCSKRMHRRRRPSDSMLRWHSRRP